MRRAYDIVIIGTGMGGGTLAYALRDSGARLLLLERGDFLPQEPQNWSPEEVFDRRRYKPAETWLDAAGRARPGPSPFPPVPHEPYIAELVARLREQGLHPFELPMGIDLRPGGRCIRCKTCDGFPCRVLAKGDADVCAVRPALESRDVVLLTRAYARRLRTDPAGRRVIAVEVERAGEQ